MKRENILRILAIGFALVILLLGAASYLAFQHSRSIQLSSAELVRKHLLTGRLVDDLQEEQQLLSGVLFRIARLRGANTRDVSREVGRIGTEVRNIIERARTTAPSRLWDQLENVSSAFANETRRILAATPIEDQDLDHLASLQEQFVELAGQIVKEDAERSVSVESQIERQSRALISESLWLLGGSFLLSLACAVITVRTTNESFRQMQWQADELNRVSWHMIEGQEAAARRFSHEMHDELGQSLTGLKAMLVGLKSDDFLSRRGECLRLLDEAISNVRELSQLLRPVILDDFGLDASLRWLTERFMDRTRIHVDYASTLHDRLAEDLETHFFRIAQEALTNVARHSGATTVRIALHLERDHVRLTVEDNGKGMPSPNGSRPSSLGMVGMRARAHHAGGELKVGGSPLGGVRIEAWAVARKAAHDAEQKDPYFVS
ncbi:MAG: sensor histidine kinase [Bryobacterales bacterium]|nr:sensor histidine kinase [Bryobacterales bacterium]